MLFQSVGARYTFASSIHHLTTLGSQSTTKRFKNELSKHYKGEVSLYRKGRAALAEAVRIATGGQGAVAISGFTCYSVVEAVQAAGCRPVYVDIDASTLQFTAAGLKNAFDQHADIRAVIVQNTLGIPADIEAIEKLTSQRRAMLIEDLAHSAGATYKNGTEVGLVGDITMLSFGRDKSLDAVNGGVLVVRRPELIVQMRDPKNAPALINQFRDRIYPGLAWLIRTLSPLGVGKYIHYIAYKTKLAIRSADGGVHVQEKMPHWLAKRAFAEWQQRDEVTRLRRMLRTLYVRELKDFIPAGALAEGAMPIRLPLIVNKRDATTAALREKKYFLEDVWYDQPVSPARLYKKVDFPERDCPVAVEVAKNIMNVPTHQIVRPEHITEIAAIIREVNT